MKKFLALTLIGLISLNGITAWGLEGKKDIINNIDVSKISSFKDVQNHWSKPYVTKLLATGIISGYDDGTFKPQRATTRGEFIKMLIVSFHEDPGVSKTGHWAESYEKFAIEKGYLLEKFDNLNKHITREEIATLVSRSINERADNLGDMKKAFKDYPVNEEAANHIMKVAGLGIIKGDKGEFRPNDPATRAEVSTVLIRILDPSEREIPKIIEEKPVVNKDFVEPQFKVRHYTELRRDYNLPYNFAIFIDNYKEYDESYERKVECINMPELNEKDYLVWGDTQNYARSRNDNWIPMNRNFQVNQGYVWGLSVMFYTTRENMEKVNLYEGMELKFKISIKKGDVVKEYYQTVIAEEIIKVN